MNNYLWNNEKNIDRLISPESVINAIKAGCSTYLEYLNLKGARRDRITDKRVKEWIDQFLDVVNKKYSPEKFWYLEAWRGDYLVGSDVDISKPFA